MHREALTEEGAALLPALAPFAQDFYLAGGTALALHIGHRRSVDFDLFAEAEIAASLLDRVRRVFDDTTVVPSVNNPDELTVLVNSVKVTFLHYPFALLESLVVADPIPLASISDIAAMKAYTIGQRTSFKDYVDMYMLLVDGHVTLEKVLALATAKYAAEFNDRLFLEQLVSLEDVTEEAIDFLHGDISRDDVARLFEKEVRAIKLT